MLYQDEQQANEQYTVQGISNNSSIDPSKYINNDEILLPHEIAEVLNMFKDVFEKTGIDEDLILDYVLMPNNKVAQQLMDKYPILQDAPELLTLPGATFVSLIKMYPTDIITTIPQMVNHLSSFNVQDVALYYNDYDYLTDEEQEAVNVLKNMSLSISDFITTHRFITKIFDIENLWLTPNVSMDYNMSYIDLKSANSAQPPQQARKEKDYGTIRIKLTTSNPKFVAEQLKQAFPYIDIALDDNKVLITTTVKKDLLVYEYTKLMDFIVNELAISGLVSEIDVTINGALVFHVSYPNTLDIVQFSVNNDKHWDSTVNIDNTMLLKDKGLTEYVKDFYITIPENSKELLTGLFDKQLWNTMYRLVVHDFMLYPITSTFGKIPYFYKDADGELRADKDAILIDKFINIDNVLETHEQQNTSIRFDDYVSHIKHIINHLPSDFASIYLQYSLSQLRQDKPFVNTKWDEMNQMFLQWYEKNKENLFDNSGIINNFTTAIMTTLAEIYHKK